MTRRHTILASLLAAAADIRRRVRRRLAAAAYRPELHYMRGPGPKCWEKQAAGGELAAR